MVSLEPRPIVWLTGQSGAGKTTLANALADLIPGSVVLDGDEMRASISLGAGFSKEDRRDHNLRVARLAVALAKRAPVLVSVIAPFADVRSEIDAIARPVWIHVDRGLPSTTERPYEAPETPFLTIDTSANGPEESARIVREALAGIL